MGPMGAINGPNGPNDPNGPIGSIGPVGAGSRGLGKPRELHAEDLENLRHRVLQQRQEVEQLVETGKLLEAELERSRAEHRKNVKELSRVASGNRSSVKSMWGRRRGVNRREKGLLERKRQQENQLTETLLSHYRSTVEDQVTDLQRRVGEGAACEVADGVQQPAAKRDGEHELAGVRLRVATAGVRCGGVYGGVQRVCV